MENIGILDAGVVALLGYAVVFFGLILLMIVVMVMGKAFTAKKSEPKKAAAPVAAPAAAPVVVGAGEQGCAPMPGTIVRVNVTQGQAVNAGDVLCVLEAMKMENDITAPKAGTISQVVVSKGSSVSSGDVLVVIA